MTVVAIVAGSLFVLWILAHLKTSRRDGTLLRVHPYRRMMFMIMPTRTESLVYYDAYIDADRLLAYLERARARFGVDLTHAIVASANMALAANPAMNRFVVGRRLYQRSERILTFSMKRKAMDRKSKLATVKMVMEDGETFPELCARIDARVDVERSDRRTRADKEFELFDLLPRAVLRGAHKAMLVLDYFNLLPYGFTKTDPLYTSIFVANLGSVGMSSAFHHLYEYGTCPLFLMAGKIEERAVVRDGQLVVRRQLPLRFTYDERIDDGLTAGDGIASMVRVLEDPERWLGCVAEDGSDRVPLWPREGLGHAG